jgi:hypothetical protein
VQVSQFEASVVGVPVEVAVDNSAQVYTWHRFVLQLLHAQVSALVFDFISCEGSQGHHVAKLMEVVILK